MGSGTPHVAGTLAPSFLLRRLPQVDSNKDRPWERRAVGSAVPLGVFSKLCLFDISVF